jgi:short-subunit dehydrogenase
MNMRFENKVVVVTGASSGVGRATARAFAEAGADVGLLARGLEGLEGARREIEGMGRRALAVQTDVADAEQVEHAAERVERELGPIDIWVNNAMVTIFGRFVDVTPEEYRRATDVTYLGVVYGTMSALRRMMSRNRGVILQVGSALAYRGIPLQAPYCGAKHAIEGFTESLRTELMHDGIHVDLVMVHLPGLNTPQFHWGRNKMGRKAQPVPPIFQPEVAADAILWNAERVERDVSVGWPTVAAVWGNRVAPEYLDRRLARTGFQSQLRDEPVDPGHQDNLFEPVPGDHGARGEFDEQAQSYSWQWELRKRAAMIAVGAGTAAAAAIVPVAVRLARRNGRDEDDD